MAIIAPIENGKVVEDTTKNTKTDDKNKADKEMFLKLLVAEMQYQDPLEPTTNTDYVKELASFTQIEAVQSVEDQMANLQANSLVGKYVVLLTSTGTGDAHYVSGKVDYVMEKDGEMFLSVNDGLYSINDLDSVCDETYYNAVNKSQEFHTLIEKLPGAYQLTVNDADKIKEARKFFDDMSDYELQFVTEDDAKTLVELEARLEALQKAAQEVEEKENESN